MFSDLRPCVSTEGAGLQWQLLTVSTCETGGLSDLQPVQDWTGPYRRGTDTIMIIIITFGPGTLRHCKVRREHADQHAQVRGIRVTGRPEQKQEVKSRLSV